MAIVNVKWLPREEGGRNTPPPAGRYFSVARFPDDSEWQTHAWSVVFELAAPHKSEGGHCSAGSVRFLLENAPAEKLRRYNSFDIYEGPRTVGVVAILAIAP